MTEQQSPKQLMQAYERPCGLFDNIPIISNSIFVYFRLKSIANK